MSEAEVEQHNRRELWSDVANHLTVAREAIEQAQGALEDLSEPDFANQLQPFVENLRRAATDASEEAGK